MNQEKDTVPVSAVWLRTYVSSEKPEKREVQVLVETDGRWRLVIVDTIAANDARIIGHIVEPHGIRRSALDPITTPG